MRSISLLVALVLAAPAVLAVGEGSIAPFQATGTARTSSVEDGSEQCARTAAVHLLVWGDEGLLSDGLGCLGISSLRGCVKDVDVAFRPVLHCEMSNEASAGVIDVAGDGYLLATFTASYVDEDGVEHTRVERAEGFVVAEGFGLSMEAGLSVASGTVSSRELYCDGVAEVVLIYDAITGLGEFEAVGSCGWLSTGVLCDRDGDVVACRPYEGGVGLTLLIEADGRLTASYRGQDAYSDRDYDGYVFLI